MRAAPALSAIRWRRSSYSNADGGNCVEVADGFPGAVPVRDSKSTDGPVLTIPAEAWNRFIDNLKDHQPWF
ncbi:DUF397 domain-containing protein [Streptomyces caniscabiei]|uniref:DUF397 domain-containing protein n=1 Tax=Streptomyces caniscabiei TaxID=2746961 RepID=A0ABU4MH23_9ACTN|nr:DUF397 domain-containing protein [Streptomyces caniscabiei]MBE4737235.1 DUF397 domain-containing protein [Streptomyces caniscabiei]MBE4757529.1 DUF397 domain-containing protein [Streptomyces caniscabiei]MBE4786648.1 DUF397 domain-containing protein [Streptomyces caniscabiei]MBE4795098.1 DUF397 domain-containing protein [Streptomyces caniscabiei]MDX2942890.1 DUF397 domain-containing protein [Streptomyces caniscabiei]